MLNKLDWIYCSSLKGQAEMLIFQTGILDGNIRITQSRVMSELFGKNYFIAVILIVII